MRKSLIFTITMALGITSTAFAANPFADVPQGHWAYASIAKLADAGVINGYPDGTFQGNRTMTRYEMAQIVAKALAKGAIGSDDKLVGEFSEELNNLGVRVAKLEKNADKVKITGEGRFRYFHSNKKTLGEDGNSSFESDIRTRLFLTGELNDNWHYVSMLENTQDLSDSDGNDETKLARAYLDGKVGQVNIKGGRFDAYMVDGLVLDTDDGGVDGLEINLGDEEKTSGTLQYGKVKDDTDTKFFGATIRGKKGNLSAHVGYYKFTGDDNALGDDNPYIWNGGLGYSLGKATITADYLHGSAANIDDNKSGYALGVTIGEVDAEKPGTMDFFVNYWDQPRSTFHAHGTDAAVFDDANTGFKGWGVGVDYALMKNMVAKVAYYDTKEKGGKERKDQRIWSDLTITF